TRNIRRGCRDIAHLGLTRRPSRSLASSKDNREQIKTLHKRSIAFNNTSIPSGVTGSRLLPSASLEGSSSFNIQATSLHHPRPSNPPSFLFSRLSVSRLVCSHCLAAASA